MSRQIVEVRILKAGQPRAYADSFYEAEITCRNWWNSTTGEREGSWSGTEKQVREIARQLVRGFEDNPGMLGPRLEKLEKTGDKWHVLIVEPYCD